MPTSSSHEACGMQAARRLLLDTVSPLEGWQRVPLREALGRVLASDQRARFDVPAHDSSAMQGYAVRAEDIETADRRLTLVGDVEAGRPFSGIVGQGQAVRIATGAQLPRGADSVVMREHAREEDGFVLVGEIPSSGQHVRRAGEDLSVGSVALSAGTRVGPSELGLLASLGHAEVSVMRRPRVAFFAIGDELKEVGRPLAPGELYDSNRYTLWAALQRLDADVLDMGALPDDPAELQQVLRTAAQQADAIITTGGGAVTDTPVLREQLGQQGEVHFWHLDIRPGRPMSFGRIDGAWWFGLPGNPVAALVNYYQLVLDALQRLSGINQLPLRPTFRVRCADAISKRDARREYPRGVLFEQDGEWQVCLTAHRGSGVLSSMVEGNCFIILPEEKRDVAAGDWVDVQPFEGLV